MLISQVWWTWCYSLVWCLVWLVMRWNSLFWILWHQFYRARFDIWYDLLMLSRIERRSNPNSLMVIGTLVSKVWKYQYHTVTTGSSMMTCCVVSLGLTMMIMRIPRSMPNHPKITDTCTIGRSWQSATAHYPSRRQDYKLAPFDLYVSSQPNQWSSWILHS